MPKYRKRDSFQKTLHTTPRRQNTTLAIFAQDPAYTPTCIAHLTTQLNISVLSGPDAFVAVTPTSFIFCIAPDVPVKQIVMGLTCDAGGPAGVLCDLIDSDGMEYEGESGLMPCTDPNSPDVWAFKQSSAQMEWGGDELWDNVGCYLKKKRQAMTAQTLRRFRSR